MKENDGDNVIHSNGDYRGMWSVELIDCDGYSNANTHKRTQPRKVFPLR